VVDLPADSAEHLFPIPAPLHGANFIVELAAAGERKTQIAHSSLLRVSMAENFGILDVKDAKTNRAVSKAYVKVYARLSDGSIRFYKDGYTDLRGKFDYGSLNSVRSTGRSSVQSGEEAQHSGDGLDHQALRPQELDQVEQLAVLVLSDTLGAAIREVAPPRE
jgi:hypothetical protein